MLRLSTRSLRLSRKALLSASAGVRGSQALGKPFSNLDTVRAFSSVPGEAQEKPKGGILEKCFGLDSNVASETFKSRWMMVLPAFATHMAIGSTWAWSLMADVITREQGFVAPAPVDWSMMDSVFPLSIVFAVLGFSASALGKWQIKVGARKAVAAASLAFGGGCLVGAAGVYTHCLPLLYLGYGGLAGLGLGMSYTPPVQTLMQWFPDKKGLASGLCIAGFGSGALVFTPIAQQLMKHFAKMPEYLGPAGQFVTQVQDGKLFADVNGALVEVVQAGTAELAKIPYALSEGLYVVGTGATGAAETLAVTGAAYFAVMLASALAIRKPHPAYKAPEAVVKKGGFVAPVPARELSLDEAMRQPQFYLLGASFYCLAAGGIGMLGVAKPMMSEVFSAALPTIVTSDFAAKYILMLSAGNLGGRLAWAAVSDKIGRKNTWILFTAGSLPLYLALPTMVESVLSTGSTLPLYAFCLSTAITVSVMGGSYAITPAYEADLFGSRFAGAVHGRMLLFSSAAALSGPPTFIYLRSLAEKKAVTDLLTKISPESFQAAFGAPMDSAMDLLASKTLSIGKLLALAPPGTIDPSPHLYNDTMYTLAGMMGVGFLLHSMVRPVASPLAAKTVVDTTGTVVSDASSPLAAAVVSPASPVSEETVGDRQVK